MDKWQAQDVYWNSFGLPAYNELTVPEDAKMPLITYEAVNGRLNGIVLASASVYYMGKSWSPIMQKTMEIERYAEREIPFEGGVMKVRIPDNNFAQPMGDEDKNVRRIKLAVEIEFLSM